ncbi:MULTISPECIES: ATP-binding protein [unclassified Vibrio]|uniref:Sensory/regulatory protein RpfC n=1 Tax=Vibrio sp. HB236076 TaxID=3232307 RepID=A0AB39HB18_9VIBR|nr:ATP-binding protein [Vibrio sp. HB161653]MDP5254102.1 ATP-binding protein [Vibrio sp. HB161653]
MLQIITRSIVAKIILVLSLLVVTIAATYIVMAQRLSTIHSAMNNVTEISTYTTSILSMNKELVEIQRDISVYSNTGSQSVLAKISQNLTHLHLRIQALSRGHVPPEELRYVDSLSELVVRFSGHLEVLVSLHQLRSGLIDTELESIYQQATTFLESSERESQNAEMKLSIVEKINDWHTLHRSAWLFLTKKDFTKKQSVNSLLNKIAHKSSNFAPQFMVKLDDLVKQYQVTFTKSVQANRNYLSLINVVIAGDAIEFSTQANKLKELSLERLNEIKKVGNESIDTSVQTLIVLSVASVVYMLGLSLFFHLHIAKAIILLTQSFRQFLAGNLSASIHGTKREDEIGLLAEAASRFRDVSQDLIVAKQNAEHTTKIKSEFLANMSHEIRTPMNGVLGMAWQLSTTELSASQRRMLEIIQSSGNSLLVIINDILDLSKIEAGKIELEHLPISLQKLCEELEHLFRHQAEEKGIQLFVNASSKDTYFLGDETRIKQVLMNLLSNAIKFTDQGRVALDIDIDKQDDNKQLLTFRVTDSGIGIDDNNIKTLFDAFSQADTSITRRYGGTGLGLTITSKLLSLMQTELNIDSQLGKGSCFYFTLDSEAPQRQDFGSLEQVIPAPSTDFSHLKILVAEDNEINQVVIESLLHNLNITTIVIVDDGKQAVEQCQAEHFDLILMDMQMPVLDGLQATSQIKQLAAYQNTPIIALTANVLETDKQLCLSVGMCDFLTKPLDFYKLEAMLVKWGAVKPR